MQGQAAGGRAQPRGLLAGRVWQGEGLPRQHGSAQGLGVVREQTDANPLLSRVERVFVQPRIEGTKDQGLQGFEGPERPRVKGLWGQIGHG